LALARAVGLEESYVISERGVAAGTRFAADAYVAFARTRPWIEAVASSLTELFGPPVMERRVAAILQKYPWIDPAGMAYFERRIPLARRDAESALSWVLEEATTTEAKDRCVEALRFKCNVLWSILDATALACGVFK
jgi:pyrroloquinoline-quinone synthase